MVRLIERIAGSSFANRIDRSAKVIRGVKIIGLKSANAASVLGTEFKNNQAGYEYSPAALKEAIQLYEGARVSCGVRGLDRL
jgi:hypothetical protein